MAGFVFVYMLRYVHQPRWLSAQLLAVIAPAIFILAAAFAIAGPILIRAHFAHRQRDLYNVSTTALHTFEKRLIVIPLVAPYLALAAYYLQLPRFHLAGALLMGLYAVYYYYPSARRIALDKNIYRVADSISATTICNR